MLFGNRRSIQSFTMSSTGTTRKQFSLHPVPLFCYLSISFVFRFGFSNNVTPKDTKNPVDTHTVVLFVIGGVSLAEAGEVNQVIRSFHEHDSLGRNSKKRIILISNSLLSTDSCYSQVISNMMNK